MGQPPTVYFVEDDHSVLDSLLTLVRTAGYQARGYLSATELLEEPEFREPGCLVIDFKLPRLNGVTLQQRLRERGVSLPAIFISGHIHVDSAVGSAARCRPNRNAMIPSRRGNGKSASFWPKDSPASRLRPVWASVTARWKSSGPTSCGK